MPSCPFAAAGLIVEKHQDLWEVYGPRLGRLGSYVPKTKSVRCLWMLGRVTGPAEAARVFKAADNGEPVPGMKTHPPLKSPEYLKREAVRKQEYHNRDHL